MKKSNVAAVVFSLGLGTLLLSGCGQQYDPVNLDNISISDTSSNDSSNVSDNIDTTDTSNTVDDNSTYDTSEQDTSTSTDTTSDSVTIGMNADQVKSIEGEPSSITKETVAGTVAAMYEYDDLDGVPYEFITLINGSVYSIQETN